MNITLIGMAGAGKSYIGKRLAKRLGYDFLDVDRDLWEVKYGKPIQEILDEIGEERYLNEEEHLIIGATKGKDNLVISPPGSIAYLDAAKKHLDRISRIVYLKVPYQHIEQRLRNAAPRAIIGLGRKTLRDLYDERDSLYAESAHGIVDVKRKDASTTISAILDLLRLH